jgi:hypothetical protein
LGLKLFWVRSCVRFGIEVGYDFGVEVGSEFGVEVGFISVFKCEWATRLIFIGAKNYFISLVLGPVFEFGILGLGYVEGNSSTTVI